MIIIKTVYVKLLPTAFKKKYFQIPRFLLG